MFAVTVLKNLGDGAGFVAAAGEHVAFTLTDANGASHSAATGTCTGAGANTDANGQCTIIFSSPSAGTVTGHASVSLTIGTVTLSRATGDGAHGDTANAVKKFVDAKISISPDATNEVGQSHTFTVTVLKNLGDGAGFVAAAGEHVAFTLTDANGASHSAATGTCTGAGAKTIGSASCRHSSLASEVLALLGLVLVTDRYFVVDHSGL